MMVNAAIDLAMSFIGSMAALAIWLHFDLQLWRQKRGRRLEKRQQR